MNSWGHREYSCAPQRPSLYVVISECATANRGTHVAFGDVKTDVALKPGAATSPSNVPGCPGQAIILSAGLVQCTHGALTFSSLRSAELLRTQPRWFGLRAGIRERRLRTSSRVRRGRGGERSDRRESGRGASGRGASGRGASGRGEGGRVLVIHCWQREKGSGVWKGWDGPETEGGLGA